MQALGVALLTATVGLTLAACGTTTVNTTPATPATAQAKSPAASANVAHVGATVAASDSSGDNAKVTLVKVIDPARGANQFATPDKGKSFVGVVLKIADANAKTLQGDANNYVTVIGSDQQTYTADFAPIAKYTNFNNGSFTIPAGQSSLGAVTFQLPKRVKVVKVQFDLSGGFGGGTVAQWRVP
jgi:hypothetical protein